MNKKKVLSCLLAAAMVFGTFAVPSGVKAAEADTIVVGDNGNVAVAVGGENFVEMYDEEGDLTITKAEVTDGADYASVFVDEYGYLYVGGIEEGKATVKASYKTESGSTGSVEVTVWVNPFEAYFGLTSDQGDIAYITDDQAVTITVNGLEYVGDEIPADSELTWKWNVTSDVEGAAEALTTAADGTSFTMSGASNYDDCEPFYEVTADLYYGDAFVASGFYDVCYAEDYYVVKVDGFKEDLAEGESCTITPSLYHYTKTSGGAGEKVTSGYTLKKEIEGFDCKASGSSFILTRTSEDYCYIDLSVTMDEMEYWWSGYCDAVLPEEGPSAYRFAGNNRYETATMTAEQLYDFNECESFDNFVIACGTNFPDALAGCPLAAELNAPILLAGTGTAKMADGTVVAANSYAENFIQEYGNEGANVYLLGGTSAVGEDVETWLKENGYNVVRLAGDDRYGTNMEVINAMDVAEGTDVVIVRGYTSYKSDADKKAKKNPQGYADSLSISGVAGTNGWPIFLANSKGLTQEQIDKIAEIKPEHIYVVGGTAAVSEEICDSVSQYGEITRLAGDDRYKTSVAIAETFGLDEADSAVVAYGQNFPDGLTGGVLAAYLGAPVLLVEEKASARETIGNFLAESTIQELYVAGGTAAISDDTVSTLLSNLN